jgi:hypothetical protein
MKDLVIVPTCGRRPEFLWVFAEHLAACNPSNKEFWICEDVHAFSEQTDAAVSYAVKILNARLVKRTVRKTPSDNIWVALEDAYQTNARLVYFLEDDIMVTPGLFSWSEKAHESFDPFVVCADNLWIETSSDPLSVGISHSLFEPRAASIKRERMSHFLRSDHMYAGHPETVIQNYIIRTKKDVVWPLAYRALDCGWYGENKFGSLNGSLQSKVGLIKKSLVDPNISNRFIKEPFNSVTETPGELYIGLDHRTEWEEQYKSQARWGF